MAHSAKIRWWDAGMALALLMLGILLCVFALGLLSQWQQSSARHQGESVDILLGGATAVAGIALLLWWAVSILSASASVLLERLGRRRAAAAARSLSPAFMQRAVVAALSLHLVTGVAANAGVISTPGPEWTPTQAQTASSAPSSTVARPNVPQPTARNSPGGEQVQNQRLPHEVPPAGSVGLSPGSEPGTPPALTGPSPGWQPAPPVVEPGLLAAPDARTAANPRLGRSDTAAIDRGGQTIEVTVLAGDTLWDIVGAHLGPEASDVDVALEWPRWFAANRAVIGGSPDVLLPGQILHAPAVP
ncbi:LysM peptidoglycan-binding domain-containing protein [Arthrobacter sp. SAFR-179]|uniref:LysM peptidoglycan-binding domain-containing protein n=1 Tax=Arthrobacter sp. SAFR-179 TaxID=3387279 RepID=UPI003F7B48FB